MTDNPLRNITTCLPSLSSVSLVLYALWLIFQTNLFIVRRRLSAEVTGRIDPFLLSIRLTSLWLWKWSGIIHRPPSCTLQLLREEEHNRSLPGLFTSTQSQSFCTSSCLDLSQRGSWSKGGRYDLQQRVKVGLLIPRGSTVASLLSRMDVDWLCVWIKWYFIGPCRESVFQNKVHNQRKWQKTECARM